MRTRYFAALVMALATADAAGAGYTFRVVADSRQFRDLGDAGSINCAGDIAFTAENETGAGVFATRGQTIVAVFSAGGKAQEYGIPSINDAGDVLFLMRPANRPGSVMLATRGGKARVVIDGQNAFGRRPVFDDSGRIAYIGQHGAAGVFIDDGRNAVTVNGPAASFIGNYVGLNGAGEVAFAAKLENGSTGVFVGNGAGLRTIAGPEDGDAFWEPAINDTGSVVFLARKSGKQLIYRSKAGVLTTFADSGVFVGLGKEVSINNSDVVTFAGWLSMSPEMQGIYTGADPQLDGVIRTGDTLDGAVVKKLQLGPSAINDAGQIVFKATLVDGVQALAVATPAGRALVAAACGAVAKPLLTAAPSMEPYAELARAIGPSRWIEGDRERHTRLLSTRRYDALVVPFQASGDTLDAPGRSLLARELASRLQAGSGLTVADPGLVEKALGEPARNVALQDVFALGQKLGVKRVIVGRVGHDRRSHMMVTIESWSGEAGRVTADSRRQSWQRKDIEFSDTRLPETVFRPVAEQVAAEMAGQPAAGKKPAAAGTLRDAPLPASWEGFVSQAGTAAVHSALALEFLGSLYPAALVSRPREHLFERALMVLEPLADTAETRLLRARALAALGRRPAALAVLGEPAGAAGGALRAYLNADLPALQKLVPQIRQPMLRLMAEFDLQDVLSTFGRPLDETLVEKTAADAIWGPFAMRRLMDADPWSNYSNAWTKIALDTLLPAGTPSLEDFAKGRAAAGLALDEPELARSVLDHVSAAYRQGAPEALGRRSGILAPWSGDLLQLAVSVTLANAIGKSRTQEQMQGRPREALDTLRGYETLFADNPLLTLEMAEPMFNGEFAKGLDEQQSQKINDDAVALTRKGVIWLGQQNESAIRAGTRVERFFPETRTMSVEARQQALFVHDFPRRLGIFGLESHTPEELRTNFRHCAQYTVFDLTCVATYHYSLLSKPDPDPKAAAELLRGLDHRFVGHPSRLETITQMRRRAGEDVSDRSAFEQAVAEGSAEWTPYSTLGLELVHRGRYAEARDLLMKYPGFHGEPLTDAVTLSNYAYEAGNYLFWAGRYEEAQPFYGIAAGLNTGSDASLGSAHRLALLAKDLPTAMEIARERARRYDSIYAYRDYLALLHLLGDSDDAWALFDNLIPRLPGGEKWLGAYVGHRLSGTSEQEVTSWSLAPKRSRKSVSGTDEEPARYVFLMGITDRMPPEDFEKIVRSAGGNARYASAARGLAHLQHGRLQDSYEALHSAAPLSEMQEFLPDLAWAAALTQHGVELESSLRTAPPPGPERSADDIRGDRFYGELALAVLTGLRGAHDEALGHLRNAVNDRPNTANRVMLTDYQIIELAERLHAHTGEDAYRAFGFDQARRYQTIQPMYPWTYAFAAQLAPGRNERVPYLAAAMKLDPYSLRVSQCSAADRDAALQWARSHEPLYLQKKSSI